jgi:hypothetical protein
VAFLLIFSYVFACACGVIKQRIFVKTSAEKKEVCADGAIKLGTNAEFSLLNSIELFAVPMLSRKEKLLKLEGVDPRQDY